MLFGTNDSPDILPKDAGTSLFLVDTDKLFLERWTPTHEGGTPDEGLEPSTTRLKVWRSTD